MTYYLKYRPQTIDELDLTSVRERLKRIVDSGKFSHAYLFSGPRGTGKTSAARIMAKAAGISPVDILEMDAASNRGIDDVRELRERVGLSPAAGNKKAYIIDEIHMMTTDAFNALLKTLEEPPPHVIFFLCTTEFSKLPATIVSRCVKIDFTPASAEEIERSLKRVAAGEKLKIDAELIKSLAGEADGSFREVHTILEEAALAAASDAADAGGEILEKHLESVKASSLEIPAEKLAGYLINGDSAAAINIIESSASSGVDLTRLAISTLENLRRRLISGSSGHSERSEESRLLLVAKTVEEKVRTIRYAPLPQLTLEIAALELAIDNTAGYQSSVVGSQSQVNQFSVNQSKTDKPKTDKPVTENRELKTDNRKSAPKISLEEFMSKWPAILTGVRRKNHGIVTLLSHCRPVDCADGTVNIAVKYKFHRDQLTQDRFRQIIESAVAEVTGAPLRLKFNLSPQTVETLKNFTKDDNIEAVVEDDLAGEVEKLFMN